MSDFFSSQPSQLLGTKKSKILVDFYQIPLWAGTSYTLLTFKIGICLFESQNYKRKDRERTSICLFYSPDGHNGQTLARQKPRVSFRVCMGWQWPKLLDHLLLFQAQQQGVVSEVEQPGHQLVPIRDAKITGGIFTQSASTTAF